MEAAEPWIFNRSCAARIAVAGIRSSKGTPKALPTRRRCSISCVVAGDITRVSEDCRADIRRAELCDDNRGSGVESCGNGRQMNRIAVAVAICSVWAVVSLAQQPAVRFEVASVKQNNTDAPPSSRFPLGPGDAYAPGTLFSATNQPLINYVRFAFGRSQGEQLRLPAWAYDERFDIQGRAAGEPTKDDMRGMVRALLSERFKLVWHVEQREAAVLELVLAKPGELGSRLRRHTASDPCQPGAPPPADAKFAAIPCGSAGFVSALSPGRASVSARGEPIARLATLLSNNSFAGVDRVVLDHTGLMGPFDFGVEWAIPVEPLSGRVTDDIGPPLDVALRRQLGLTLRPTRSLIDVPVIDHIERPTPD